MPACVQCPWRLPLATREALPLPTTPASPRSHLLRWSVPAAHPWASTVPAAFTWEISKQPCCPDSSSFLRLMSQTSPWNFLLWSTVSPLCLFGWPAIVLIFCGLSSFFFFLIFKNFEHVLNLFLNFNKSKAKYENLIHLVSKKWTFPWHCILKDIFFNVMSNNKFNNNH